MAKTTSKRAKPVSFTSTELEGLKRARTVFPTESQRGLAAIVHQSYDTYSINSTRSTASIYAQIRKLDAAAKPVFSSTKVA